MKKRNIVIITGITVTLLLCFFILRREKDQTPVSEMTSQENKISDTMLQSICYAARQIGDNGGGCRMKTQR